MKRRSLATKKTTFISNLTNKNSKAEDAVLNINSFMQNLLGDYGNHIKCTKKQGLKDNKAKEGQKNYRTIN